MMLSFQNAFKYLKYVELQISENILKLGDFRLTACMPAIKYRIRLLIWACWELGMASLLQKLYSDVD